MIIFIGVKFEKDEVLRKSPPGEGGFEEGDAPCRGLLEEVGVKHFHILRHIVYDFLLA